ncbi:tRNA 2-thiouridine(34) synthase MnmA [Bartonella acomydis]
MFLNSLDLTGPPEDFRIVVAMSGGVDSSVVAGLLKKEGYNVIGITLQLYDHGAAIHRVGACCAGQDIEDARRVAETLGIPHYVLDYEKRFREAVIDPFAESYAHGETPVPCVACNQTVKFADLLATARQLGADALATGHYIRSRSHGAHRALFRPLDVDRDQSYFLFATTQEQIDYLRFPLGDLPKARVREIAAEMGFVVANKHDSQDICFVPQGKYSDVITKLRPEAANPGAIVHIDGQVLGKHAGIMNYTVGQRRGIGVATGEALYVVYLDVENARVIVGPREMLETHKLFLRDVNWLGDERLDSFPSDGVEVAVKVRSTRPPHLARLHYQEDVFSVDLLERENAVAPGQACVFYDGNHDAARILGGGFVIRSERAADTEVMLKRLLCNLETETTASSQFTTIASFK